MDTYNSYLSAAAITPTFSDAFKRESYSEDSWLSSYLYYGVYSGVNLNSQSSCDPSTLPAADPLLILPYRYIYIQTVGVDCAGFEAKRQGLRKLALVIETVWTKRADVPACYSCC